MNIVKKIMDTIKPPEVEKREEIDHWSGRNLSNRNIYCEIKWNQNEQKLWIYRYNNATNISDKSDLLTFPRNPVPSLQLHIPVIVHYVNWKKLLQQSLSLKEYTIEFNNYMSDAKMYTVLMVAFTKKNKRIVDTFASTPIEYINPDELLQNIIAFLTFANKK